EPLASAVSEKSCNGSDQRIGDQISAGGAEKLCEAARSGGIEYGHSERAFGEVENQGRESATGAQHHAHQQHAEVLQRERHGREGQRKGEARTKRDKKTGADNQRDFAHERRNKRAGERLDL